MEAAKRYEFNSVSLLSPYAVGVPGKRTFFLAIGEKDDWIRVWVEKEHLLALVAAIDQLLSALEKEHVKIPRAGKSAPTGEDRPQGLPSAEIEVLQMALGYKDDRAVIEIGGQRVGSQEENPAEVYCQATLSQLKNLRTLVAAVCAAGRPICPRCGGPIDPEGHVCPEQN